MADFFIKRGATKPVLNATIKDANGDAVDLSTNSQVLFRMAPIGIASLALEKAASVTSAEGGRVQYAWAAADTEKADNYHAEFEVQFQDGTILVSPSDGFLEIVVGADVSSIE